MRALIGSDVDSIREGLSSSPNIDYYHAIAEFVSPYTLKVEEEMIKSKMILRCIGSKTIIPPIENLESVGFITSDTILNLKSLPESVAIVGGGYIAAEYGHFLASMGSKVTIIGRNERFLPDEEPEISSLAKRELGKHITILTNCEVKKATKTSAGLKKLVSIDRETGNEHFVEASRDHDCIRQRPSHRYSSS